MWIILILVSVICEALGAPSSICPEPCVCHFSEIHMEAQCTTLQFLKKPVHHKLKEVLVSLSVENSSLTEIEPQLKNLRSLTRLNLKQNNIVDLNAAHLPESLKYLDLSHNFITNIPRLKDHLPNLKELYLAANPIVCTCELIAIRDELLKSGVHLQKDITCDSPDAAKGKPLRTITCDTVETDNMLEQMQQDEADVGSGSGEEEFTSQSPETPFELEFIPSKTTNTLLNEDYLLSEGSGDGGETNTEFTTEQGDFGQDESNTDAPLTDIDFKVCYFDCTTPLPLNNSNESNSSPNLIEAIKTVIEDIIPSSEHESSAETETTIEPEEDTTVVVEVVNKKKLSNVVQAQPEQKPDEDKETQSIEQQPTKQSNSTYIFLSVLLVLVICLTVWAVVKQRSKARKSRRPAEKPAEDKNFLEEMQPMRKTTVENVYTSPEVTPLINGQNGTHKNKSNEHLPTNNDYDDEKDQPDSTAFPYDDNDVELRSRNDDSSLLTPEAKRVTIKAGELSDSIPKTPLLITRHLNSEGNIVTSPSFQQSVQ